MGRVEGGKKNHEILEFMNSFIETPCLHVLNHFAQQHGEAGVKQLGSNANVHVVSDHLLSNYIEKQPFYCTNTVR